MFNNPPKNYPNKKVSISRWIFLISFLLIFGLAGVGLVFNNLKNFSDYQRAQTHLAKVNSQLAQQSCSRGANGGGGSHDYSLTDVNNASTGYKLVCAGNSYSAGQQLTVYVVPGSNIAYISKAHMVGLSVQTLFMGFVCLVFAGYFAQELMRARKGQY